VRRGGQLRQRAVGEREQGSSGAKYPKAVATLDKDADALLTFFDFPAEHWKHLRTSNVIESPFATVRLRQRVTKGAGSRTKGLLMAYSSWTWRRPGGVGSTARTSSRSCAPASASWMASSRRGRPQDESESGIIPWTG